MIYIIIFISALVLEVASTKYIQAVAEKKIKAAAFWAFLSPVLNLFYISYLIESDNFLQRLLIAVVLGLGYATGSIFAMYKKH
jgi:hypothetical protein